ncbi:hypothetical protein HanRHA438_Chr09g0404601 [Helianthus annuus]|nr:hypothetical protein HanRHA438_Chr09g0404601 [Helianthus annuus]
MIVSKQLIIPETHSEKNYPMNVQKMHNFNLSTTSEMPSPSGRYEFGCLVAYSLPPIVSSCTRHMTCPFSGYFGS